MRPTPLTVKPVLASLTIRNKKQQHLVLMNVGRPPLMNCQKERVQPLIQIQLYLRIIIRTLQHPSGGASDLGRRLLITQHCTTLIREEKARHIINFFFEIATAKPAPGEIVTRSHSVRKGKKQRKRTALADISSVNARLSEPALPSRLPTERLGAVGRSEVAVRLDSRLVDTGDDRSRSTPASFTDTTIVLQREFDLVQVEPTKRQSSSKASREGHT